MDKQDKIIIIAMIAVFCGGLIYCIICNAQNAEAEEQAQLQARAAQVESVKAYIQDAEDEELAREETNRQINAEKAEQARLEAERLAQEQAAREEQARRDAERLAQEQAAAEQARQDALKQAQEVQAQQEQEQTQNTATESVTEPTGTLTKAGGVNYYNGSRETWYSSNQLYHHKTSEWTVGADGVYRDKDGYVVVARSDMAQGATVETSLGTGKVYDSGCSNGTTDIYTKW